jgi:hypothetical protein
LEIFLNEQIKPTTQCKTLFNFLITENELAQPNRSQSTTYLTKAQMNWEKKTLKTLNSICTDVNIPLAKKRNASEGQEIKRLWNELGTNLTGSLSNKAHIN